jgi:CDP-paratose 2-epimerase
MGGGSKNTLSLLELLDLLKSLTGKSPDVSMSEWRPSDQKVYISDTTRAQERLGWKPTVTPIEGVKRVVRWVEANRNLFA